MLFTEDGWVAGRDAGKSDIYLFAYGLDYRGALNAFYTVSGKTPLIPRWALGNWWSRYCEWATIPHRRVAHDRRLLATRVPGLDGSVQEGEDPPVCRRPRYRLVSDSHLNSTPPRWLNLRHLIDVPAEYGTGWTGYTWDKKLFPDHIQFMKDLHERNLKVSLNVHPADGVRTFETAYEEMCKALNRDSSTGVVRTLSANHSAPFANPSPFLSNRLARSSSKPISSSCITPTRMKAWTFGGWTGNRVRSPRRKGWIRCGS